MVNYPSQNPYIPMYQQPRYQTPVQNGIIWVQGIEGAKGYQVSPNSVVLLMDNDTEGRFYIKVSDNVGMCSLRIFNFTEVTEAQIKPTEVDFSQYVTKDELTKVVSELKGVIENGNKPVSAVKPVTYAANPEHS